MQNKNKMKSFQKQLDLQWAHRLPENLRFQSWITLIESRFTYASHLQVKQSKKFANDVKSFYY